MKDALAAALRHDGHDVIDVGTNGAESVDYPDIAVKLGAAIQDGSSERGVFVCGSGVGACVAAESLLSSVPVTVTGGKVAGSAARANGAPSTSRVARKVGSKVW